LFIHIVLLYQKITLSMCKCIIFKLYNATLWIYQNVWLQTWPLSSNNTLMSGLDFQLRNKILIDFNKVNNCIMLCYVLLELQLHYCVNLLRGTIGAAALTIYARMVRSETFWFTKSNHYTSLRLVKPTHGYCYKQYNCRVLHPVTVQIEHGYSTNIYR
jgi:hypothetical protein